MLKGVNRITGLQEENGRWKAEKGSGGARPALSTPDNTRVLSGLMGCRLKRARRRRVFRNAPCSRWRRRAGLLPIASSYPLRPRTCVISCMTQPRCSRDGASRPHSPERARPQFRESHPWRGRGPNPERADTRGKTEKTRRRQHLARLREMQPNLHGWQPPRRLLGNVVPARGRDPDAEGPGHPYSTSGRGRSIPRRPSCFSSPKPVPPVPRPSQDGPNRSEQ